jgi:hypothetical protein
MLDQKAAWVPSASERRKDISAEIPALLLRTRDTVMRETLSRVAAP